MVMQRWGSEDLHSYCIGFTSKAIEAEIMGEWHGVDHRGGKYNVKVVEYEIEAPYGTKDILLLTTHNEDRQQQIVKPFLTKEEAKQYLLTDTNSFFDLRESSIYYEIEQSELDEIRGREHCFSTEAQEYLKGLYENTTTEG